MEVKRSEAMAAEDEEIHVGEKLSQREKKTQEELKR